MSRIHRGPAQALTTAVVVVLAALAAACDSSDVASTAVTAPSLARGGPSADFQGPIGSFEAPVFDIGAAPDGSILVGKTVSPGVHPTGGTSTSTVKAIRRNGKGGIRDVVDIETMTGAPINGLAPIGRGKLFASVGGLDLAVGAGVVSASDGQAQRVGDIESFEKTNDPDANSGHAWKAPSCEQSGPFSAGPQSNPYHLTALSGSAVLVADAAGNSLLRVDDEGNIDVVATFSPPVDATGMSDPERQDWASSDPADWMPLPNPNTTASCYVQPVPTSVAVGPDGAYYVGELTGLTPGHFGAPGVASTGLSRVWRVEPGTEPVACPSDDCSVAVSGLTSVIDLAFGLDGTLYVAEYDENSWARAINALGAGFDAAGGTIDACDVASGTCTPVEEGLVLPAALTVDKWGGLWVLENNLGIPAAALGLMGPDTPTVRAAGL